MTGGAGADADVLVVGAGPAGVAAALGAADRGLRVRLVDRAAFPRDKTCGDGLTAGALRRLEALGLDLGRLPGWSPGAETVVVSPGGRHIHLPLPEGPGHWSVVVPRIELDAALVHLARARGVVVEERTALAAIDDAGAPAPTPARSRSNAGGGDAVTGELEHDGRRVPFRAGWVVAADGHYSPTRRLVTAASGPMEAPGAASVVATTPGGGRRALRARCGGRGDRTAGEWAAFRRYWRGVADRRLWVLFDADLLPGYAWIFPLPDGRANVGFGVPRQAGLDGKALARIWRELPDRPGIRAVLGASAEPDGPTRAWPIASAYDRARLACGRVLFVGDAAAVADPMTGEGVAQALETGTLASAAIADGSADPAVAYAEAVDRSLGADVRFSRALSWVLARRRGAECSLRAVDLNDWTRRNFARWMWEDYPTTA